MSPYAHITGWGMYVPQKVVTNQDLSLLVNTTDEWITSRTGIKERRIATGEENNLFMASEAALRAIEMANLKPSEIDLIIVATSSPEQFFPSTACLVQDQIGAPKAGAFDLLAACSGFIFALNTAAQAIRAGSAQNVVVIGVETLSRLVDWKDRSTCILFGDGAGAFVLQAHDEPGGFLAGVIRSDGSGGDLLHYKMNPVILPFDEPIQPSEAKDKEEETGYIHMDGREVFRFATRVLGQVAQEAINKAHLTLSDISLIIPHQANRRIIDSAMQYLHLPPEKCYINVERYGNTSTASIPIATCEAFSAGLIKPGDKLVFVGFGAGLTWGASVVEWSQPFPSKKKISQRRYKLYARLRSWILRLIRRIDSIIWSRRYSDKDQ